MFALVFMYFSAKCLIKPFSNGSDTWEGLPHAKEVEEPYNGEKSYGYVLII